MHLAINIVLIIAKDYWTFNETSNLNIAQTESANNVFPDVLSTARAAHERSVFRRSAIQKTRWWNQVANGKNLSFSMFENDETKLYGMEKSYNKPKRCEK